MMKQITVNFFSGFQIVKNGWNYPSGLGKLLQDAPHYHHVSMWMYNTRKYQLKEINGPN